MKFRVITFGLLLSLLMLSKVQSGCNYFQNMEDGILYYGYNEEYPSSYGPCTWRTEGPYVIKLNCTINIPPSTDCFQDSFSVQFAGQKMDKYCGQGKFEAEGRNVTITFKSHYPTRGGWFLCQMQTKVDERNCQCGWRNLQKPTTRIAGGRETDVNEYPMMAGLVDVEIIELYCGATIISPYHVLTAAHCVENRNLQRTAVVVGEHDVTTGNDTLAAKVHRIKMCTMHPQYKDIYNDIAVCEVSSPIQYNARVGPVCLPFQHRRDSFMGSYVTLLGWGMTSFGGRKSNILQAANVSVISNQQCANSYYPEKHITDGHMCAHTLGKDACQMDSGGPALWQSFTTHNLVLTGITVAGRGCASDSPAIYTRVGYFIDWIMSVTPGKNQQK